MGFTTIVPVEKPKTGAFRISTVQMRKDAPYRLQISMPAAQYTVHFGAAEQLTVQIGDGPDEGKMLITPDPEGAFKPRFMKHAVLLRFPDLEFSPQFQMVSEDPERRRGPGGAGLLIDLPEWVWSKERQAAIRKAREQVARERGQR